MSTNAKNKRNRKYESKGTKSSASNRQQRKGYSKDIEYDRSCNGNDPSWYSSDPALLKDAASFAYSNPIGNKFKVVGHDISIPGVCKIGFVPGVGFSKDNSSHINLAARRLYSFIRHANSGHSNYDSPDLMMYLCAVDSVYTVYTHIVRAYGVANLYSQNNRYLPDGLLYAMNFNPSDIRENLADFRYGINVRAAKISTLYTPNTMSFFKRHSWMCSNIFKDAPSAKSQMYVLSPVGYYVFSSTGSTKGGFLEYHEISGTMTCAQWLNILDQQIAALIEDEDMGIMAGDILKAYGANNLNSIAAIGEGYVVPPVYSLEVLTQIQNATIVGKPVMQADIKQDPDTNAIVYTPRFRGNPLEVMNSTCFTLPIDSPEPANTMVASRLTVVGVTNISLDGNLGKAFFIPTNFGTEIVTGLEFIYYDTDTSGKWVLVSRTYDGIDMLSNDTDSMYEQLHLASLASKFDMHPSIKYTNNVDLATTADYTKLYVKLDVCDYDNVTIMSESDLAKMHECACLSEFGISSSGVITQNTIK